MEPSDVWIAQYRTLAGIAAEFEIRIRLISGANESLSKHQYDKLEDLEELIHDYFKDVLSTEEKEFLSNTRTLRNKVMHADFKSLMTVLEGMGHMKGPPKSWVVKLTTGDTKATLDTTKKEGGIIGWLMESANGVAFKQAETVFKESIRIYKRVSFHQATKDMRPEDIERMKAAGLISEE